MWCRDIGTPHHSLQQTAFMHSFLLLSPPWLLVLYPDSKPTQEHIFCSLAQPSSGKMTYPIPPAQIAMSTSDTKPTQEGYMSSCQKNVSKDNTVCLPYTHANYLKKMQMNSSMNLKNELKDNKWFSSAPNHKHYGWMKQQR